MSTMVLNALADNLSVGEMKLPAALWITTLGSPNSWTQVSTATLMAAGSRMSHCKGKTLFPVSPDISLAVASSTGNRLAAITTLAPNWLNLVAIPLPKPVPPPVMNTTRSWNEPGGNIVSRLMGNFPACGKSCSPNLVDMIEMLLCICFRKR